MMVGKCPGTGAPEQMESLERYVVCFFFHAVGWCTFADEVHFLWPCTDFDGVYMAIQRSLCRAISAWISPDPNAPGDFYECAFLEVPGYFGADPVSTVKISRHLYCFAVLWFVVVIHSKGKV